MKPSDLLGKVMTVHVELPSGELRHFQGHVQYRESNFDFVSRLMEEQGIYYYFKHDADTHSLVLVDDPVSHGPMPGYEEIPYYPPHSHHEDHIDHWSSAAEVQSGAYGLDDYDFKKPKAKLFADRTSPKNHEHADLPRYDYPGGYLEVSDGSALARVRLEEQQAEYEQFEADAACAGLGAGYTFTLTAYPREDQNKSYLSIAMNFQISAERYESKRAADESHDFRCSVIAIDSQVPFRPARLTPRPRTSGPQTATVVGKAGEEIWTDEFGRVRLQFHWDREGKSDEKSSCWVRVGQIWAGSSFGAQFIPRIGQEVIVDFFGGDPDRPIIVGSVYNSFNLPPFTPGQTPTQSGIKSQSTKGGNTDTANEIRFEDKKGSEQLYIQAEKDKQVLVKANRRTDIGDSDKLTIENDRTKKIGKSETIEVGTNRKATIGGDDTTTIAGNRDAIVGGNDQATIAGNVTQTVGGNVTQTVGGNVTQTVGGNVTETIAGALTQTVAGGVTITTPAAVTIAATGGFTVVAPAGTKTVDSFFEKLGGVIKETFSAKFTTVGAKMDLVAGVSMSVVNNKVDFVSMKVDQSMTKLANNPTKIETYGTAIMQGYCNLHTCGLVVIQ